MHRIVVETEPADDTGPKVLDEDVGTFDQSAGGPQIAFLLEIQYDGLLPRVDGDEGGRHAIVSPVGAVVTHRVAAWGRFDLDHLGAEESQKMRGVRAGHHVAQVGNTNALEDTPHPPPPTHATSPLESMLRRALSRTLTPSIPKRDNPFALSSASRSYSWSNAA